MCTWKLLPFKRYLTNCILKTSRCLFSPHLLSASLNCLEEESSLKTVFFLFFHNHQCFTVVRNEWNLFPNLCCQFLLSSIVPPTSLHLCISSSSTSYPTTAFFNKRSSHPLGFLLQQLNKWCSTSCCTWQESFSCRSDTFRATL